MSRRYFVDEHGVVHFENPKQQQPQNNEKEST